CWLGPGSGSVLRFIVAGPGRDAAPPNAQVLSGRRRSSPRLMPRRSYAGPLLHRVRRRRPKCGTRDSLKPGDFLQMENGDRDQEHGAGNCCQTRGGSRRGGRQKERERNRPPREAALKCDALAPRRDEKTTVDEGRIER